MESDLFSCLPREELWDDRIGPAVRRSRPEKAASITGFGIRRSKFTLKVMARTELRSRDLSFTTACRAIASVDYIGQKLDLSDPHVLIDQWRRLKIHGD
jgi:hypothetical protein